MKHQITGHKLHLHLERILEYKNGLNPYPILVELSPTSHCNHKCVFCCYDFLHHSLGFLDPDVMLKLVAELGGLGVKSLVIAGDGEPLLNKGTPRTVLKAKESGLDVGLSTNGVLLSDDTAQILVDCCTWLRFSCNAGNQETYKRVHRGRDEDFGVVQGNIKNVIEKKHKTGSSITIGVQFVLLEENVASLIEAVTRAKDLGVDYFSVKPFIQHPDNPYKPGDLRLEHYQDILKCAKSYETDDFQVTVRFDHDLNPSRNYTYCHGVQFIVMVSSNGEVHACLPHQGDERFSYGNIHTETFVQIWNGAKRKKALSVITDWDKNTCQVNCRHHIINQWLWEVMNPGPHKNFI